MTDETERLRKIERVLKDLLDLAEEKGYKDDGAMLHACAILLAGASENEKYPIDDHVVVYSTFNYVDRTPRLLTISDETGDLEQILQYAGYDNVPMCEQFFLTKHETDMDEGMEELEAILDDNKTLH